MDAVALMLKTGVHGIYVLSKYWYTPTNLLLKDINEKTYCTEIYESCED